MSSRQPYSAYDDFAWLYSKDWGAEYHAQAAVVLEKLVFSRLAPPARVLDLCCGTGDLARLLLDRGYRVTGIEGSEEMLRYARAKAPAAEFIHADARDFDRPPVFDAVLSTFDSLNHVLSLAELERAFANACRALAPGGFFCFDMNMETCFRTIWRGTSTSIEGDNVWIIRGVYDAEQKLGRAELTMFRADGGHWRRSDVTITEKCYSRAEIYGALETAGFALVEDFDAAGLGMMGDTGLGRSFFLAFKS